MMEQDYQQLTKRERAILRARRYLSRVEMMLEDRPYPDQAIIGYLLLTAGELWIGMGMGRNLFRELAGPLFDRVRENVVLLPKEGIDFPSPLPPLPPHPPLPLPLSPPGAP